MIFLNDKGLPAETSQKLADYQDKVDKKNTYEEKVSEAKKLFKSYNVKGNKTFDKVKEKLTEMCCGPHRCNYCEDSKADEVEHIQPKDWYPEHCFVWDNYCYACGPCNGPKNNKFAIFRTDNGQLERLERDTAVLAPPAGTPVLINPRQEDPLEFLFLDMSNTFFFTPINDDKASNEYKRADYTAEILGLNSRSYLVKARRIAYGNYRARLTEYITQKNNGASQAQLNAIIEELKEEHHQTVWQEIKRQQAKIPQLANLFQLAPEALNW